MVRGEARSDGASGGSERWSACYAPHASMYFDQFGKVRACCQNTGVYLGDVNQQSLREIWESADAEHMRTELEAGSFDAGCEFCHWQEREGNDEIVFARQFDRFEPEGRRTPWPRQMEFSLTNTCNLQCAMCNGDWSSTIRAKREGRPPLAPAYDDAFYEQLAEFLPHLDTVAFLGGEPFLGKEPLRVMELLAELDDPPDITITTNGTIFTDRVQRIVERLAPNIVISLDGASPETYDQIRIGAHFTEVMANLDRFRAALGSEKVSIAHCLMTTNWHEFGDLLQLAEDRDLHVGVNVVVHPPEHSLYHLPVDELDAVVAQLQATDTSGLTGRRSSIWDGYLEALAHRVEAMRAGDGPVAAGGTGEQVNGFATIHDAPDGTPAPALSPWPWLPFPTVASGPSPSTVDPAPEGPVLVLESGFDAVLHVRRHDVDLPHDARLLDGRPFDAFGQWLRERYGSEDRWEIERREHPAGDDVFRCRFTELDGPGGATVRGEAIRGADGALEGGRFTLRFTRPLRRPDPVSVSVSVGDPVRRTVR